MFATLCQRILTGAGAGPLQRGPSAAQGLLTRCHVELAATPRRHGQTKATSETTPLRRAMRLQTLRDEAPTQGKSGYPANEEDRGGLPVRCVLWRSQREVEDTGP